VSPATLNMHWKRITDDCSLHFLIIEKLIVPVCAHYDFVRYNSSKKNVAELRTSVGEIKTVLTSRKTGQTDLKKLWLQKTELEETIRMLNSIEQLKVTISTTFIVLFTISICN
jgi:hypothetical protein